MTFDHESVCSEETGPEMVKWGTMRGGGSCTTWDTCGGGGGV